NPFNPSTMIEYILPEASHVKIEIYNLAGQKIKTLIDSYLNAGRYTVQWNGTDDNGTRVASGVYIYRLIAGNNTIARKMILLK
ncbi:FlgD immunoglobulin-like domain containing protein, partial [Candidatus Kryptobacter tengchongensis]